MRIFLTFFSQPRTQHLHSQKPRQPRDTYLLSVNCGNVINGKTGFCACHSCLELLGDCDSDDQCQEDLRCGSNNCPDSLGFDAHIDCCYTTTLGDDKFCTIDKPCEINEGDCDSNDECKSHLFCGLNNCQDSLGFSSSLDCCEPKGDKTLLIIFQAIVYIIYQILLSIY